MYLPNPSVTNGMRHRWFVHVLLTDIQKRNKRSKTIWCIMAFLPVRASLDNEFEIVVENVHGDTSSNPGHD